MFTVMNLQYDEHRTSFCRLEIPSILPYLLSYLTGNLLSELTVSKYSFANDTVTIEFERRDNGRQTGRETLLRYIIIIKRNIIIIIKRNHNL